MTIITTVKTSAIALALTVVATTSFASIEPKEIYSWRAQENVSVENVVSNHRRVHNESVRDIYANARGTSFQQLSAIQPAAGSATALIMAASHNKYAN